MGAEQLSGAQRKVMEEFAQLAREMYGEVGDETVGESAELLNAQTPFSDESEFARQISGPSTTLEEVTRIYGPGDGFGGSYLDAIDEYESAQRKKGDQ